MKEQGFYITYWNYEVIV